MVELRDFVIYESDGDYYIDSEEVYKKWVMKSENFDEVIERSKRMGLLEFIAEIGVEDSFKMEKFIHENVVVFDDVMDVLNSAFCSVNVFDAIVAEIEHQYPEKYVNWENSYKY